MKDAKDFREFVASEIRRASVDGDSLKSVKLVIEKHISGLITEIREAILHLRFNGEWYSVGVIGYDDFRTWQNKNPNGGDLSGYSNGKPLNAYQLFDELAEYANIRLI